MASEIIVNTIKAPTSGANANKVIIPSGVTLDASAGTLRPSAGTPIQIVQNTTTTTAQYASVSYLASALTCDITPKYANSKFHIHVSGLFGSSVGTQNAHDVAFAWNLRDSLNPSGANAAIAPDSTTGGTDTTGSAGTRMGGYHAGGSYAAIANAAHYWIWNPNFSFLYTPSYQNTNQRTFGLLVKTALGYSCVMNMSDSNFADPRDVRGTSIMTITEIAQ